MSLWSNLVSWGIKAAKTEAQSHAMDATKALSEQINHVLQNHVPDMAPALQPAAQALIQGLVAAALSKAG